MKLLLFVLLILAAAVGIGLAAMSDPGYVLITRKPWSVELSLGFFLVLLVLGFLLLYLLIRLAVNGWHLPARMADWRRERRRQAARESQSTGLLQLMQGEWHKAERSLLSRAEESEAPLINYLGAAIAAQQDGDAEKRDRYLAQAHSHAPKATLAIGLTQAALLSRGKQTEQALAALTRLHGAAPKNTRVLELMVSVYRELRDWKGIAAMLKAVEKQGVFPPEQLQQLQRDTYRELLSRSSDNDAASVTELWDKAVPRGMQRDPVLVGEYAQQLIARGGMEAAESILRKTIDRDWDSNLVGLYGRVRAKDPVAQLKYAERWVEKHPYSPNLLLTLGRLALRNQLWGRARSYLESSLGSNATVDSYNELAHLLERLGERDKALELYRKCAELAAPVAAEKGGAISSGKAAKPVA